VKGSRKTKKSCRINLRSFIGNVGGGPAGEENSFRTIRINEDRTMGKNREYVLGIDREIDQKRDEGGFDETRGES